uniref:Transcription factor Adf-1 n=1 Tax=Oncorhynchus kisutch TaxID=8019 RepID=A0A8C7CV27_ONCKI
MDEKLILSVFNFPELYNTTLPDYRNGETRSLAWRRISALTALPAEECKRKWKNLRDRYFKEVRQEKRSKEETGERTTSRWKYRQLLNFLQPFIKPRNGNADHDNQESPDTINKSTQSEIKPVKTLNTALVNNMKPPTTQVGTMSQLAFVTQQQGTQMAQLAFLAKLPPGAQISPAPQPSSAPQLLAKEKDHRSDSMIPNRQCDEDEMFLLSFVPALKRLAPQKRCETKIKIQQIMYEAEFKPSYSSVFRIITFCGIILRDTFIFFTRVD